MIKSKIITRHFVLEDRLILRIKDSEYRVNQCGLFFRIRTAYNFFIGIINVQENSRIYRLPWTKPVF